MRRWQHLFWLFIFLIPLEGWSLVFLNSSPFKASVYIGKEKMGETPLVIRTNTAKNIVFRIEKKGFYTKELNVQINSSVTNFNVQLISKSFSVQFPNRQYIILNGKKFESDHIQNLPNGYYLFEQDKESIYARRVNPNRSLLYMNLIVAGVGIVGGITGVLVGNEMYSQFKQAQNYSEALKLLDISLGLDNFAMASFTIAGASSALSIYYFIDDLNVMKKNKDIKIKSQEYLSEDRDIFEKALDEMGQNRAKDAVEDFNRILDHFPESRFYPMVLLRRAEIYNRQEKYEAALKDLEKLRSDYPVYEIYELAMKSLADTYIKLKKNKEALSVYQELRQINSIYPTYLIDYYYIKLLKSEWDETGRAEVAQEIRTVGKEFGENAGYPDSFKAIVRSILAGL